MKQNKYDDPQFFAGYASMARSTGGLAAAGEWPVLQAMLPPFAGKRVLDLGCGFGWHCRYAREQGAASVLGVDISENMLQRAREMTDDPQITYLQSALEDLELPDRSIDVALSSLALHYVRDIGAVLAHLHRWLVPGGAVILSVEHPVFTAMPGQDWYYAADGTRLHWPVDNYQDEGIRHTSWLADDVIKYHRTLATWLNTLIASGLRIAAIAEPQPSEAAIAANAAMRDEMRRPTFLIISAVKES